MYLIDFFQYAVFLALLLLAEMTAGILFFVFKDWVSYYENTKQLFLHFQQYMNEHVSLSLNAKVVTCSKRMFQIKQQATMGFQTFITHYREDPDQQNLIDWIQEDWVTVNLVFNPIAYHKAHVIPAS